MIFFSNHTPKTAFQGFRIFVRSQTTSRSQIEIYICTRELPTAKKNHLLVRMASVTANTGSKGFVLFSPTKCPNWEGLLRAIGFAGRMNAEDNDCLILRHILIPSKEFQGHFQLYRIKNTCQKPGIIDLDTDFYPNLKIFQVGQAVPVSDLVLSVFQNKEWLQHFDIITQICVNLLLNYYNLPMNPIRPEDRPDFENLFAAPSRPPCTLILQGHFFKRCTIGLLKSSIGQTFNMADPKIHAIDTYRSSRNGIRKKFRSFMHFKFDESMKESMKKSIVSGGAVSMAEALKHLDDAIKDPANAGNIAALTAVVEEIRKNNTKEAALMAQMTTDLETYRATLKVAEDSLAAQTLTELDNEKIVNIANLASVTTDQTVDKSLCNEALIQWHDANDLDVDKSFKVSYAGVSNLYYAIYYLIQSLPDPEFVDASEEPPDTDTLAIADGFLALGVVDAGPAEPPLLPSTHPEMPQVPTALFTELLQNLRIEPGSLPQTEKALETISKIKAAVLDDATRYQITGVEIQRLVQAIRNLVEVQMPSAIAWNVSQSGITDSITVAVESAIQHVIETGQSMSTATEADEIRKMLDDLKQKYQLRFEEADLKTLADGVQNIVNHLFAPMEDEPPAVAEIPTGNGEQPPSVAEDPLVGLEDPSDHDSASDGDIVASAEDLLIDRGTELIKGALQNEEKITELEEFAQEVINNGNFENVNTHMNEYLQTAESSSLNLVKYYLLSVFLSITYVRKKDDKNTPALKISNKQVLSKFSSVTGEKTFAKIHKFLQWYLAQSKVPKTTYLDVSQDSNGVLLNTFVDNQDYASTIDLICFIGAVFDGQNWPKTAMQGLFASGYDFDGRATGILQGFFFDPQARAKSLGEFKKAIAAFVSSPPAASVHASHAAYYPPPAYETAYAQQPVQPLFPVYREPMHAQFHYSLGYMY